MEAATEIIEWLTWLIWAAWIINIAIYVYLAICLQTIAHKTGTEHGWLAWIPIANAYLMCKIAGRPWWWLLLFFIPIVNIVLMVIVWMGIAEARDKKGWLGILMIVPIANLVVPGYLAFSGGDAGAERLEALPESIAPGPSYMIFDEGRPATGGITPQANLVMPEFSNYAAQSTVVSAMEVQAEEKAREVPKVVTDIGSRIHEKTVQLVLPLSASLSQVAQFKEHLEKVKDLTIVMISGSADEGSIITVSPHESTDLIRILNQIPMVENVHKKGEAIVVKLKPPGAVGT
jgi:hypothetical protein